MSNFGVHLLSLFGFAFGFSFGFGFALSTSSITSSDGSGICGIDFAFVSSYPCFSPLPTPL